jgi:drug/metabolite transporter (DMT)-like permease
MSQNKLPKHWGILLTLISTIGFSLYPVFGKLVFAEGANVTTILFTRFTLSSLFFGGLVILTGGFPKLTRKLWFLFFLMGGIAYASMSGLYLSSVAYIPTSLAALIFYTYPILVTGLSIVMKQDIVSRNKIVGILFCVVGLVFILGLNFEKMNMTGILLAMGTAITYSIYIMLGNFLLKKVSPLVSTAIITTFAAFSYGLSSLYTGFTWNLSLPIWLYILGITLFSTIIAVFSFLLGVQSIGPTSASIVSSLEPLMTFIFASLFFNEKLTLIQGFGGLLVLAGGIFAIYQPNRLGSEAIRSKNDHL